MGCSVVIAQSKRHYGAECFVDTRKCMPPSNFIYRRVGVLVILPIDMV